MITIHSTLSVFFPSPLHLLPPLLILLISSGFASGFGSMGPISAAFGNNGFFCAIDASGKQELICWGNNITSSSSPSVYGVPPMAALAGGEDFMCGILSSTSQAYCWNFIGLSSDLVPSIFRYTSYSHIAAGKNHVCAIRGSYFSDDNWGLIDCWDIIPKSNSSLISKQSSLFYEPFLDTLVFTQIVSGDGFSCGGLREGGVVCWGPNSASLGISGVSENFVALTSGVGSLCGVIDVSGEVKCWGNTEIESFATPQVGKQFVSLAAGARHFCGIRADDHGIECWGSFNSSVIPKGSGFFVIASSDFVTCGIREDDLVLDCWFANVSTVPNYGPPLQLCSPGLCSSGSCGDGEFSFNASILNEPDLTSLCVRKDLKICSPCGFNCTKGFFPSSSCNENANRVCTACSLCQNSSCWDVCKLQTPLEVQRKHQHQTKRLVIIVSSSVSGFFLVLICWSLLPRVFASKNEDGTKKLFVSCIGKQEVVTDKNSDPHPRISVESFPGAAQVFRLSELKDATNGFKEFNELGRGSYGFVYKAVLADGKQLAVKRANAAKIIQTHNRDFEMELEILCNVRHSNIVNLLGYCAEMGERLLVYEYMLHGTLYDHLHGGLSPLNWNQRLKIVMQAAKGLEYLHKEVEPPIVHRDVKSSNILLDADWVGRIADFGLLTEMDLNVDMATDVYNFGVVLLEVLSGRKAYDRDCMPPSIVEWALPLIRQGKAAAIIDRYVELPRNVEPLLKLADIAEVTMRENPIDRPTMSEIAISLEQLVKDGLIL